MCKKTSLGPSHEDNVRKKKLGMPHVNDLQAVQDKHANQDDKNSFANIWQPFIFENVSYNTLFQKIFV
jgi:hypothetical protein